MHVRNIAKGMIMAAVLATAYAVLPIAKVMPPSPDEASNAFFARRFAENGVLWHFEPLSLKVPDVVHPRSVRVVDDMLVPGGFLGLPVIYGGFAAVLGTAVIPFLTPFFAMLGVFAWYGVVRVIFGRRIGLYAAALLAVHPAWWYAASRTMMPNVLFATLMLTALWIGLASPFKAMVERAEFDGARLLRRIDPVIAGMLLAFAVAVRPAELHWIAIVGLIVVWPLMKEAKGWPRIAVMGIAAALAIAPFLLLHQAVYGNIFASGYGTGIDVPTGATMQGRGNALLGPLRPYLFPLGFAPMNALRNGNAYGLAFFPWWTLFVAAGIMVIARSWKGATEAMKRFYVSALVLSVWLVLFYGSWVIQDNPDPSAVTIGSSYLRYWLPIFICSTVPVALLLEHFASRIGNEKRKKVFVGAMLAAFVLVGADTVISAPGEGLRALIATDRRYQKVVTEILGIVPAQQGLLITDRTDKYFFGTRSVMSPLRAESTYDALPTLIKNANVFYFGITLPEKDLAYLRETILAPRGIIIEPIRTFDHETLYSFDPLP